MRTIECENKAVLVVKIYELRPQLEAGIVEDLSSHNLIYILSAAVNNV
jgi:hypothetical protein